MSRLPLRHWWSAGLVIVSMAGLGLLAFAVIRLHWVLAALLIWFVVGYFFDKTILHRWAGCFQELVTKNVSQAEAWYRKALDNGSSHPEVQARVGHFALLEKDYPEACRLLLACISRLPGAIQPRLDVALAHSALGQHQEAERQAKEATTLAPRSDATWLILAQVRKTAGDIGGSQAACERALLLNEDSGVGHRMMGETLYHQGDLSAAQRHLQRAVTPDPAQPESHFWLGTVYLDQKSSLRAQQELTEALNRLIQPTYASDVDRSSILQKLAQAKLMSG